MSSIPNPVPPPRRAHLFLDEADNLGFDQGWAALAGFAVDADLNAIPAGIALDPLDPLDPGEEGGGEYEWLIDEPWARAIWRIPHARDRRQKAEPEPFELMRQAAQGGLRDARWFVVYIDKGGLDAAQAHHLGDVLLVSTVVRHLGLRSSDELCVHAEHRSNYDGPNRMQAYLSGSMASLERVFGRTAALPKLRAGRASAERKSKVGPMLDGLGCGLADHALADLGRLFRGKDGPPIEAIEERAASWGFRHAPMVLLLRQSPGTDGVGTLLRLQAGDLDTIDWSAVADFAVPSKPIGSLVEAAKDPMPARAARLQAIHDQLGPRLENPARSVQGAAAFARVAHLLEITGNWLESSEEEMDEALVRRHRFLQGRALTHAGLSERALRCLADLWGDAPEVPTEPGGLFEWLEVLQALVVASTDQRDWSRVGDLTDRGLGWIAQYLGGFSKVPQRAAVLGALGQARVLAGREREALKHFHGQVQDIVQPFDSSYPVTWALVAIGRCLNLVDRDRLPEAWAELGSGSPTSAWHWGSDPLTSLLAHQLEQGVPDAAASPFLLWGWSELLAGAAGANLAPLNRLEQVAELVGTACKDPSSLGPALHLPSLVARNWATYLARIGEGESARSAFEFADSLALQLPGDWSLAMSPVLHAIRFRTHLQGAWVLPEFVDQGLASELRGLTDGQRSDDASEGPDGPGWSAYWSVAHAALQVGGDPRLGLSRGGY